MLMYRYDETSRGVRYLRHRKGDFRDYCPPLYPSTTSSESSSAANPTPADSGEVGTPDGTD